MGFAYDDAEGEDECDDIKVDKEYLKGAKKVIKDLQKLVDHYLSSDDDEKIKDIDNDSSSEDE